MASKDPAILEFATKLKAAKTEVDALMLLVEAKRTLEKPAVTGLVRFGVSLKDKEVRKLRELNPNLAGDFVILEEGSKPDFVVSGVLFFGGLVLLGLMLKGFLRKQAPSISPVPPSLP